MSDDQQRIIIQDHRVGNMRGLWPFLAIGAAILLQIHPAVSAAPGADSKLNGISSDEIEIATTLARSSLHRQMQGWPQNHACLYPVMRIFKSGYNELLTGPALYGTDTDEDRAYLKDAQIISRHNTNDSQSEIPIAVSDARRFMPKARLAQAQECESLTTVSRPTIIQNMAFSWMSRSLPCHHVYYRASLNKVRGRWHIRNISFLQQHFGDMKCPHGLLDTSDTNSNLIYIQD